MSRVEGVEDEEIQAVVEQVVGEVESGALPEWAPDGTPPGVVRLIADEQYIQDLGLRGLASADSAEFHQAIRALQIQLGEAFAKGTKSRGWRRRGAAFFLVGLGLGGLLGAATGGLLLAIFAP